MNNYNRKYYKNTYGRDFVQSQQNYLEDYFYKRGSGFTKRINYMISLFSRYIKGKDLLDLGCGVGTFALLLGKRGYNTVGLDISKMSINQCLKNQKKFHIKNAEFVLGNCNNKDLFCQNSFDTIIAADIIEHLPQKVLTNTLNCCYHWLKPGGMFIIHTFPTIYYYLINTKLLPTLLLPIYCIPKILVNPYIWLLDKIINIFWIIHSKRTHSQEVINSGHCNPPHPFLFQKQLKDAGFKVICFKLLEESLSDLKGDNPRYQFCKKLIRHYEIIRPTIIVVARKP